MSMRALAEGSRLIRLPRCPQCRQPWTTQRRWFTPSIRLLDGNSTSSSKGNEVSAAKPVRKSSMLRNRLLKKGSLPATTEAVGTDIQPQQQPKEKQVVKRIFGQTADKPIRTRFAPSPTGFLHLGSLRTALFCNLASLASTGGAFILRIEDTDQKRLVEGAEQRIIEDLRWLGLEWTEGPDCGGPHGPYRQSERLPIYKKYVQQLIDNGYAYRCFCNPGDLEKQKLLRHEAGLSTFYPGTCRSVAAEEAERRAAAGEPHTVRFRGDAFGILGLKDAIYGSFQKKEAEEDFIIFKTDGFPTYHLANVVDDHLMNITHVVRGEEWLVSTPKHLALYKAFGWEPPTFAHLGLLTNDDGSKLSKRNESANVATYREERYSPIAMQAWLANLGSSFRPGFKGDLRSLQDLAEALSFKFTRGGIKLNPEKLDGFDVKHHRSIALDPNVTPTTQEESLIDHTLIQPMSDEIDRLTPESPDTFRRHHQGRAGIAWEGTLTLVPALNDSATRIPYLRRIFQVIAPSRYKKRGDMIRLIHEHPYYFWRVPENLYEDSLTKESKLDPNTLRALLKAFYHIPSIPELWKEDPRASIQTLLDEITSATTSEITMGGQASRSSDIPLSEIYAQQRLIGTGQYAAAHDALTMLRILGPQEWEHRANAVIALHSRADQTAVES